MTIKKKTALKKKKKPVKKTAVKKTAKPKKDVKIKKAVKPNKTKSKPARKTTGRTISKSTAKKKKPSLSLREMKMQGIKTNLLSQKNGLLREAEEALNLLPGEINFPDMGDQATAEADRDFMLRLRDRERLLLKKIDEAIDKIDTNAYGICEECSNEIGIKRLKARPVTNLCIDCKTQQEEQERIIEGG